MITASLLYAISAHRRFHRNALLSNSRGNMYSEMGLQQMEPKKIERLGYWFPRDLWPEGELQKEPQHRLRNSYPDPKWSFHRLLFSTYLHSLPGPLIQLLPPLLGARMEKHKIRVSCVLTYFETYVRFKFRYICFYCYSTQFNKKKPLAMTSPL